MQRLVADEDLKRLFAVADLNGNGKISVGELLVFLRKLGLVMDQQRCFQVLDQFDIAQKDEELDFYEFTQFFRATFPSLVQNPLQVKGIPLPQQPVISNLPLLFDPSDENKIHNHSTFIERIMKTFRQHTCIKEKTIQKLTNEQIGEIFEQADKDGNGKLSIGELILFLRRCGFQISQMALFDVLDETRINKSNDNEFSKQDFIILFRILFKEYCVEPLIFHGQTAKFNSQSQETNVLQRSQSLGRTLRSFK